MHTTGNPPEKKPWLQHQLYRHTKTILREREKKRILGFSLLVCRSLPVKIHKCFFFFFSETSSPRLVFSVSLPAQPSSSEVTSTGFNSGPTQPSVGVWKTLNPDFTRPSDTLKSHQTQTLQVSVLRCGGDLDSICFLFIGFSCLLRFESWAGPVLIQTVWCFRTSKANSYFNNGANIIFNFLLK